MTTLPASGEGGKLKGEGEIQVVVRERVRIECDACGEPATKRHTYLLPNARRNSQSSAYGKDDCSWCSDHENFSCDACNNGRAPDIDGYRWCSTFTLSSQFSHMFLRWHEKKPAKIIHASEVMEKFDALIASLKRNEATS